jgi:cytochrome c6
MRLPAVATVPALAHKIAALAAALTLTVAPLSPAAARTLTKAPDTEDGARVFAYVCSACHLGGYNQVRYERTLQEDILRINGMLAADAIEYQVNNGKNRMPAFSGRLTEDEITNVAFYVVAQAQAGWNKDMQGNPGAPNYVKYPSKCRRDVLEPLPFDCRSRVGLRACFGQMSRVLCRARTRMLRRGDDRYLHVSTHATRQRA